MTEALIDFGFLKKLAEIAVCFSWFKEIIKILLHLIFHLLFKEDTFTKVHQVATFVKINSNSL